MELRKKYRKKDSRYMCIQYVLANDEWQGAPIVKKFKRPESAKILNP